jgi:hypothetical protein
MATGANPKRKRLTNLFELTIDTSYWTRYRARNRNPDLDPGFTFPQAVPGLTKGKFKAIPQSDADLTPGDHLQAIANTAAAAPVSTRRRPCGYPIRWCCESC